MVEPAARIGRLQQRAHVRRWLGEGMWFLPYALFAGLFLVLPSLGLIGGSLHSLSGHLTLANLRELLQPQYLRAYLTSLWLSGLTAVVGALAGLLLAWATTSGALPEGIHSFVSTFSGMASNFAGVPLAFAFIATLGPVGLVTIAMKGFHVDLYSHGFTLFGFWGLAATYLYFQIPLMVLVISPTLEGMHRWSDAAAILGASWWQYWRFVGVPVAWRPFLGALLLLFGNSFGAYGTAYALTSGLINLVPIVIGAEMSGNVLYNPGLGDALGVGMLLVMGLVFGLYLALQHGTRGAQA